MNTPLPVFWRTAFATVLLALASLLAMPQPLVAQPSSGAAAVAPKASAVENDSRVMISTELVSFAVTVTDKEGRSVPGLDHTGFTVYDNGVRQEISFFSDRDAPASVGVVFDVSGSMTGDKILRAKNALAHFIQTSHPEDEYSLISFSDSAKLLLDKTRDSQALLSQFGNVKLKGNTALYDAVRLGLEAVARGRYAKRALIVISDGEDNHSRTDFGQVRRKLQEAGVTIYTILIGPLLPRSNGGSVMDKLATVSGGKSFFPRNDEKMSEDFEQIALELRRQYSIGYTPSNPTPDGKWHRLKVEVEPSLTARRTIVRTRAGYYAGNSSNQNLSGIAASGSPTVRQERVIDCCADEDPMADCRKKEFSSQELCQ
jgi:Ca-activated chloride channel homolog